MRSISLTTIADTVRDLCLEAAYILPTDVLMALKRAGEAEESPIGRDIISSCLENAAIAAEKRIAICQDTGFAVFFVEIGTEVHISGGTIQDAIDDGTTRGYARVTCVHQ